MDWRRQRFDLTNTGHAPTRGPDGPPACRWKCDVGYSVSGTPAVAGDSVYVATAHPTNSKPSILGVDREAGEVNMRTDPDDPFVETRGSPSVVDGVFYVSVLDFPPITRGYDATTGERVREYDLQPAINTDKSPVVVDGVVYSPGDYALSAFDARTEEELWTLRLGGKMYGTPALTEGTLYVGVAEEIDGTVDTGDEDFPQARRQAPRLQAIDAATGRVEWDRNILPVPDTPAVVDETCYVCGREPYRRFMMVEPSEEVKEAIRDPRTDGGVREYGVVQALATDDGAEQWRKELSERAETAPAVTSERVIVGTDAGNVLGLDATTGEVVWRLRPETTERVRAAPVVADGVAYVASGETLYALNSGSGAERWQYDVGTFVNSSIAVVDGTVYLVGRDQKLRAIE